MISIAAITLGLATIGTTFIGGLVALKFRKFIKPLIAFCGGTLVAAALLDLLPEALEIFPENHLTVFGLVLGSFILFHIIDKVFLIHGHSHGDDCHDSGRAGLVGATGLIIHSFLDGLVIGTGFLIDPATGILVASVVLLHDFADGVNTVTLLLRNKQKTRTAFYFLIGDAFAPLLGVLAAHYLKPSEDFLGYILSFFAGFFIYMGATDLLPEAHKERSSVKLVLFTILGAISVTCMRIFIGEGH